MNAVEQNGVIASDWGPLRSDIMVSIGQADAMHTITFAPKLVYRALDITKSKDRSLSE